MKYFIFTLFLFSSAFLFAQTTEWAYEVESFSSERTNTQYSANQVCGSPNAYPNAFESPVSWSPSKPENKKPEFVKVKFRTKLYINQIVIAQNYNPGAIQAIYIYNTDNREFLVFEKGKQKPSAEGRLFNYILPKKTPYKVRAVKVVLNTKAVPGFNCIDAIGVSEAEEPVLIKVDIKKEDEFTAVPENLGKNVNSYFNDYIPQISPDGKELYFVRSQKESIDIYKSKYLGDGFWSIAQKLGAPLNNENENFVYTITPDGNTLLLGNSYEETGSSLGVATSLKKGNTWSKPKTEEIKNLTSTSKYNEFFLGPNKKVLLMTLQNKSSIGETDIFISHLQSDKTWSEPENLGNTINTADIEASPFLAADNRTLYFASQGHRGYGKTDIFVSKRIGKGWNRWSEPKNLGPVINTSEGEFYYSVPASGEYAYYVSKNNTFGGSDIFRVKLPQAIKPKPVALVIGNVYNAKTKEPLEAEIQYEILPEGIEAGVATSDEESGAYKIALPIGEQYGFFAAKKGFIAVSDNIDLKEVKGEYTEIRRDLYLAPIEVGQSFVLNNIMFDRSKFELKDVSKPELNRLVEIMNLNPNLVIKLNGHTDNRGSKELNQQLSEDRVKEVKKYLTEQGIQSKRIQTEGYGSSKPLNKNLTDDERRANRRVELEIVSVG